MSITSRARRPALAPLALLLPFPATLAAQRAGTDGRTAPATISGASCTADGARLLGALRGDFDVAAAFRAGPAAWDSTTGHARLDWELGGCLLAERYEGTRYGAPYAYVALWGTSGTDDHRMQRVAAHSQHGLLVLSDGAWNARGDTLVLSDSALVNGRWIHQRSVIVPTSDGGFTLAGERSEDGGRSWVTVAVFRYRRRAARDSTAGMAP
jgi:hypothetical protein